MTQSLTQEQSSQLRECFALAQDLTRHEDAKQAFSQLKASIAADAMVEELLEAFWNEVLSARRSSAFWQQMSNVEKEMADRMAESHVQLKQNYLRLVQEQ